MMELKKACRTYPIFTPILSEGEAPDAAPPLAKLCKTLPLLAPKMAPPSAVRVELRLQPGMHDEGATKAIEKILQPDSPQDLIGALGRLVELGVVANIQATIEP